MEERNTRVYRQGELQDLTLVVTLLVNMLWCKYRHCKVQVRGPPKQRMAPRTTVVIGRRATCSWTEQGHNGTFVACSICQTAMRCMNRRGSQKLAPWLICGAQSNTRNVKDEENCGSMQNGRSAVSSVSDEAAGQGICIQCRC